MGNLNAWGFSCQCLSSLCECARIVLIGLLLNKNGLSLDPLTALSYYAPLRFVVLIPFAVITEMPKNLIAWRLNFEEQVGYAWMMLNGAVAFGLNLATVLLIQKTSPVVYILCGIMKDVLIISGSVAFHGATLSGQQALGYALAVASIQIFGQVRKAPGDFEHVGLLRALWNLTRGLIRGLAEKGSNEAAVARPK